MDKGASTVFQTFEWLSTWHDVVGQPAGVQPRIVVVADRGGTPLLLLPLAICREPCGRSLQFLGGHSTDYNAPVVAPRFAAEAGPDDVRRLWAGILDRLPAVDLVRLERMPLTVDGLPNPLAGLPGLHHAHDAYAATLPPTFAAFAKARSAQFFSQNRRKRRKLEALGPVEVVAPDSGAERAELVRFLLEHKSRWQVASGLANTFGQAEQRALYERLTQTPFAEGGIHVAGLKVGGAWVAALWGTVFRGQYAMILTTYREDWSQHSVGRLLMESVIQDCIARGDLSRFDLTVGGEGYKAHWADRSDPLYDLVAARSLRGRLFLALRRVLKRCRQAMARAPGPATAARRPPEPESGS